MSRRAAVRAGTALGTAAIAGSSAEVIMAQDPNGGSEQAPDTGYRDENIGPPVRIPADPQFVRGRSLEQLMRDAGIGGPDQSLRRNPEQDERLLQRVRRLEQREVDGKTGQQSQLIVDTLAAIVAQTGGAITVQFQIREYVGRRPPAPTPDDIVTLELGPATAPGRALSDVQQYRIYFV